MPDTEISALSPRLRRLAEKAQRALESDHCPYVVELCTQVLQQAPGCLAVRQWRREAQLRQRSGGRDWLGRARGSLTGAGWLLASRREPAEQLDAAEKILAVNPTNATGLRLLATAAAGMGFPNTAVFAWQCLRERRPHDREALRGLTEACLAAERLDEALEAAGALQRLRPHDGEVLALVRRASVAQTLRQGGWEQPGGFDEKLRDRDGPPA